MNELEQLKQENAELTLENERLKREMTFMEKTIEDITAELFRLIERLSQAREI